MLKNVRNTVPWTNIISDLNSEIIGGTFDENELQKKNQTEFRLGKVIKRTGDKLDAKREDYDNSFNSWIEKHEII